ncbi:MAG TPA: DUF1330 domain-containing protein [Paracoccaceae bacterium]|nr:DUF1330 domain-containing protein [Paracoccaceae bacterium]
MPKAYWISHITVTDAEKYGEYAKRASVAIADHGGEFKVRGGRFIQMEGKERSRNVVAIFPSFDAAVTCYNSDLYQEALGFAREASERELVIVEAPE